MNRGPLLATGCSALCRGEEDGGGVAARQKSFVLYRPDSRVPAKGAMNVAETALKLEQTTRDIHLDAADHIVATKGVARLTEAARRPAGPEPDDEV